MLDTITELYGRTRPGQTFLYCMPLLPLVPPPPMCRPLSLFGVYNILIVLPFSSPFFPWTCSYTIGGTTATT